MSIARWRANNAYMTSATQAEPPLGIPAATVVIFRNGENDAPPEILMQIRSRTMAFAGGMAVFPGGRVDDADFELAEAWTAKRELAMPVHEAAHRIAAIRETLEEAGLALGMTGAITDQTAKAGREMLDKDNSLAPVLETFGWQLNLDAIIPFARWFPKNENISRVYDTRFYLADMGTGDVTISADNSETTRLFWVTAQGALKMAEEGEIKLIFPTRRNLERLALFNSFEEARAQAEAIPVKTIIPQIDESGDQPMLRIMEDAGYPITAEFLDTVMRG
ncbi:NUDIX hydrolase [Erythrobacter sp. W53]|uniref:NUDIX hydrolase n=1 Tax=Erythrobacter sp. W53 TaxID=3425947 RepID=UPI003D766AFD